MKTELKKYKLGKIADVVNGATPSTTVIGNYDGDVVWITPKDLSVQKAKYIYRGERNITKQGFDSCSTKIIPQGNILMSSRAPIGLLAINQTECCTNQGFKNLVVNKSLCDVEYLYYYLKFHMKEIEKLGSGTTFKEVSKEALSKHSVTLPDIQTQKQVAAVLANIDRKIELNKAINANLEAMAKQLYDYWFVQFDFPDANGRPYKSSGGKMLYNPKLKRPIPAGWEVQELSHYGEFRNGINYAKGEIGDNDYKIINVRNVSSSTIFVDNSDLDSIRLNHKNGDNYLVTPNDILIARSAIPGATRLMSKYEEDVIYCGFIICYTVKDVCKINYLFYYLKSLEKNTKSQGGGSILHNISQGVLKQMLVCIPEQYIIDEFNNKLNPIFSMIRKGLEEISHLTALRDSLLPMLMNGQVSVL